jgi:sigma-B regulation protein RsbQ
MVFAHGFGCDQNIWRFVAPSFERDYVTVLFDHVGAGGSQLSAYSSEKYATLQGYADDVVELGLELDLKNAVFVGHSTGAAIGALAAIEAEDMFKELVMIAPSPRYINDDTYTGGFSESQVDEMLASLGHDYYEWLARMAPLFLGSSARPELSDDLLQSFRRADAGIAQDFARATFRSDIRDALPRVKTRSLIMQGGIDWITPTSVGQYMHRNMSDSEFVMMNAQGHFPQLSAPTHAVAAISEFLGRSSYQTEQRKRGPKSLVVSRPAPFYGPEREDLNESLLSRVGELQLQFGRYDMYALSLQSMLEKRSAVAHDEQLTLRTRGAEIIRLMGDMPAETRAHFIVTDLELHKVLARHEISATHGAIISALSSANGRNWASTSQKSRDWFDQANCGVQDVRSTLEIVERDILKLVSLRLRVSNCALAVGRELTKRK